MVCITRNGIGSYSICKYLFTPGTCRGQDDASVGEFLEYGKGEGRGTDRVVGDHDVYGRLVSF